MKFNKSVVPKILIVFFILASLLTFIGVRAWLDTDPDEVIPPDSYIRNGQVVTIIEEDAKYFYKVENFGSNGEYLTPAMEVQITYDEYAQIRANKTYDILEKRNRHIIDDIYVDEFFRAYSDKEEMAGNYIGEVLDGYFVPVKLPTFKETQKVLINDGGIYYLATYHFDKNYNYTSAANYSLLSENQYNECIVSGDYDYVKEIVWEISYDGNTITKTISYVDVNNNYLARPIIIQLTGFEELDGYIDASDIIHSESSSSTSSSSSSETSSSTSSSSSSETSSSTSSSSSSSTSDSETTDVSSIVSSAVSSAISSAVDKIEDILDKEDEEIWLGSEIEIVDSESLMPWESEWSDNPPETSVEGEWAEDPDIIEVGGFYDDFGNFIQVDKEGNIIPGEVGSFDEDGNFKPAGDEGYFDEDGVYHPGVEDGGEYDEDGDFSDDDHEYDEDGNITDGNEPAPDNGYTDENGNFIQNDGIIIDEDGVVHEKTLDSLLLDENGRKYLYPYGYLTLNERGEIVLFGYEGYYEPNGLAHTKDGRVGYYNENGVLIETREETTELGFFDEIGDWHSFNEIYVTENNTVQLVTYPDITISTDGVSLTIGGSPYNYSSTGLTIKGAYKGYFNQDGDFIKSDKSAYKGGFYDSLGRWIDDSLYKVNDKNEIYLSYAYYDCYGVFTSPNNDKGYFNLDGEFIISRENPYENGYYYFDKDFCAFGEIYIDNAGSIHKTGSDFIITANGQVTKAKSAKGIIDAKGNYFNKGIVITPDSKIGHYTEFKTFNEGQIPYELGYYDCYGNFFMWNGVVISVDGEVGYFDENGNWVPGVEGAILDANGNWILPDGTVITPDGLIGYYDENGVFHEGENPYGEIVLDDGSYVDKNGNTVLPDGTVITPDGVVGYYDENGVFHEGENPYEGGYYDENGVWHSYEEEGTIVYDDGTLYDDGSYVDSKGNLVLPDGTVITPDGVVGYYDENGVWHEGENPYEGGYYDENGNWIAYDANGYIDENGNLVLPDGTVITPDGAVGYYDENGVWHEGENPYANGYYDAEGNFHLYEEEGILDENGNIILADGTVITPDGVMGYYDENGVFHEGENPYEGGYYDENGNWVSLEGVEVIDQNGNVLLADGTVITPDGVKGYYDENGVFHEGESPYEGGYYDENGNWIPLEELDGYYDENGVFHPGEENPYENGYYDAQGNFHYYEEEGIILEDGTVITPDGVKGYYDENGVFHEGESPYEGGYYDENGVWHDLNSTEVQGYYDENGVWHEGTVAGYVDANGNTVLPNGVVVTPDGVVGYYDENGVFHEGESPYKDGYYDENGVWHSYDELGDSATLDSNGNLILEDGTVITPDGVVGYYDENGVFHEGESPFEGGYYDENGNWIAEGYYDAEGNYIMSDGTIVRPDGTVILPDGTIVNGYIDENGELVLETPNGIGYYDSEGNFTEGTNPDANGFYDEDGNYYLKGDDGYYDVDGTYHGADGSVGYYDANGVFHEGQANPYVNGFYDENGVWHGDSSVQQVQGYYDENGVFHPGENPYIDGYYDADGNWHDKSELGITDSNGNLVLPTGTVIAPDGTIGYYDENGVWHEGENPYEGGYYDAQGVWHEGLTPDANGNYVLPDGTIIDANGNVIGVMGEVSYDSSEPLVGYYDENGNFVTGATNPYEGGYYDAQGNWHSTANGGDVWFDQNGNAHVSDGAIGYYDSEGNFHLMGEEGYYDAQGTYHGEDGTVGYYDANGVFHEGEANPYNSGYYDSEGNWHPAGEVGYYDKDGNWHESVSNNVVGYYDENGVFHEGKNPYVNGYYDENGVWHGDGPPETYYYDENGNLNKGQNPYENGWYDASGNFHPADGSGYFDANGTFHSSDGTYGYYDADGIYHEGTNPYIGGYYDSEGNWHPAGDSGYYDANGTYYSSDGTYGYYDKDGVFHEGQENPYEDGWYDAEGNWHPYGEDGYYDINGVWHSSILQSDRYKYGSSEYLLFTGNWRNPSENAMLRLAGKTVQFTVDKSSVNSLYVDTGIYVALNTILEYEEAKDILHSIAIATNNTFVQDDEQAMLIYNGKSYSIDKESVITVKALRELFKNTNIDITVARSRIGRKYALVEAIERNAGITLKFDEKVIKPKNPLLVIDNEAYVSLKDIGELIFYDYSMKPNGIERRITFTIKNSIPFEPLRDFYANTIIMTTNSNTVSYVYTNGLIKMEKLDGMSPIVIKLEDNVTATYIPLKVITRLTGCCASYDSKTQVVDLDYTDGIAFMETFYDVSNPLEGDSDTIQSVDIENYVE